MLRRMLTTAERTRKYPSRKAVYARERALYWIPPGTHRGPPSYLTSRMAERLTLLTQRSRTP